MYTAQIKGDHGFTRYYNIYCSHPTRYSTSSDDASMIQMSNPEISAKDSEVMKECQALN